MHRFETFPSNMIEGAWVQFNSHGKILRGFVKSYGVTYATVQVMTEGHEEEMTVELMRLYRMDTDIHGMDKSIFIDIALMTNDRKWFNELIKGDE